LRFKPRAWNDQLHGRPSKADCNFDCQLYPAKASIAFHSSGVNMSFAAAIFSSKWGTEDVPGIGNITGDRSKNHAIATSTALTPQSFAALSNGLSGFKPLPPPMANHGKNPTFSFSQ